MKLYPLLMEPFYQERPWGGRRLAQWPEKRLPPGPIGEAWEVSTHPNGLSMIGNGELVGKSLAWVVNNHPEELLGEAAHRSYGAELPLLVKLIDVDGIASLQVHPNDEQARTLEGFSRGKMEAWYILAREENAEFYVGLAPGTDRKTFVEAIEQSRFEECLNRINPQPGDCIFLRPGTVHACGRGVLLLEIQQSCDITYRVYDWGRTDSLGRKRELHVERALQVIDFDAEPTIAHAGGDASSALVTSPNFTVNELRISGSYSLPAALSCMAMTVIDGECALRWTDGELHLPSGASALVPARIPLEVSGKACRLVTSSVPSREEQ